MSSDALKDTLTQEARWQSMDKPICLPFPSNQVTRSEARGGSAFIKWPSQTGIPWEWGIPYLSAYHIPGIVPISAKTTLFHKLAMSSSTYNLGYQVARQIALKYWCSETRHIAFSIWAGTAQLIPVSLLSPCSGQVRMQFLQLAGRWENSM